MRLTYTHKRGASFDMAGQVSLGGKVSDMTGWKAASQVRGETGFIGTLKTTWLDEKTGIVRLYTSATCTKKWIPGRAKIDLKLTRPDGIVLISSTGELFIEEAVTQ